MEKVFSISFFTALLASISSLSLVMSLWVSLVILSITDSCLVCWSGMMAVDLASNAWCRDSITGSGLVRR